MFGDALVWIEGSGLGVAARNAGWTYALVNALHVLGAALLVGAIAVFDIALLRRPLSEARPIGRIAIPLAAGGLALQFATGAVLFAADARALGVNPAFLAKLGFIAVGLANVALFHARFGEGRGGEVSADPRIYAAVSLAAGVAALIAGRLIAYVCAPRRAPSPKWERVGVRVTG